MLFTDTKICRYVSLLLTLIFSIQQAFAQTTDIDIPNLGNVRTPVKNLSTSSDKTRLDPASPPINVHVVGEVNIPGVYTLNVSDRVSKVLSMSKPKRPTVRLIHIRHEGEGTKVYDLYSYYFHGNLSQNPYLQDGDIIYIPPHRGVIKIEGPVAKTGIFEINREKTLWDVINLAGGLTPAFSNLHPIKVIRFTKDGTKTLLNVVANRSDMRDFKIQPGDIFTVPDIINNPTKFDYSVESIPGENLFYPTAMPNIYVVGQVDKAGSFPYKSHLRVKDYLALASPTPQAKLSHAILYRNGKKIPSTFDSQPIPGDMIVVKSKINATALITAISTVMSIILTTLVVKNQF